MWLAIFFQFFVTVYAYKEHFNRINQYGLPSSNIIKCKTPLVPEGQCLPLFKCSFLMEEYRRENSLISFILTGDRCGYRFGVLHACCPELQRKGVATPKPVIGFKPTFRATTGDIDDRDFKRTERPLRFPFSTTTTSTIKKSTNRNIQTDIRSTQRPIEDRKGNDNGFQHPNMRFIPQDNCGFSSLGNKVFGGNATDIDDYPWMTVLLYRHESSGDVTNACGGSLISNRYVLTAAHCIKSPGLKQKKLALYRVRLGDWIINSPDDCQGSICNGNETQEMDIQETVMHPKYDPKKKEAQPYDIALIRLSKEAKFGHFIKAICLPFGDSGRYENNLIVAGWGFTSNWYRKGSEKLLQVKLPVVDKETCLDVLRGHMGNRLELIESQICAGGENGKDSCQGDSGGPLMRPKVIKHRHRWEIIGIVSFGTASCGVEGRPAVYTKVSSFLNWILDNMRS